MEFCKECDSIMFIKCKHETESESEDIDLTKSKLIYSCKICGYEKPTEKQDRCLYSNDYSKDLLSNKIVTNPYVCLDPTLPILNTIKCPNDTCIVNKPATYFKNKLALNNVLFNLNNKIINHVKDILEKNGLIFNENEDEIGEGEFNISKLNTSVYIAFHNSLDSKKLDLYKKKIKESEMLETYDIEVLKLTKLKNKVTYIKYDNVKMKFMYICCHCNTYWKR